MKIPLFLSGAILASTFTLSTNAFANFSIESLSLPFVIDFTSFDGSGFSPEPLEGQLDSDFWAVDGLSDGSLDFGGTATSGDFALGSDPDAVGTGGIWAFDVGGGDIALGIQPAGSDWTPGSLTLRLQNDTGQMLTSLDVAYSIYVYNDHKSSNSFNFLHSASADEVTYIQIEALDFQSTEAADNPPIWLETSMHTTITGLSIADGANYYLRWSGNDLLQDGSRDQFGLDNISISAVPEPKYFGLICGLIVLFVVRKRVYSLKSD